MKVSSGHHSRHQLDASLEMQNIRKRPDDLRLIICHSLAVSLRSPVLERTCFKGRKPGLEPGQLTSLRLPKVPVTCSTGSPVIVHSPDLVIMPGSIAGRPENVPSVVVPVNLCCSSSWPAEEITSMFSLSGRFHIWDLLTDFLLRCIFRNFRHWFECKLAKC